MLACGICALHQFVSLDPVEFRLILLALALHGLASKVRDLSPAKQVVALLGFRCNVWSVSLFLNSFIFLVILRLVEDVSFFAVLFLPEQIV